MTRPSNSGRKLRVTWAGALFHIHVRIVVRAVIVSSAADARGDRIDPRRDGSVSACQEQQIYLSRSSILLTTDDGSVSVNRAGRSIVVMSRGGTCDDASANDEPDDGSADVSAAQSARRRASDAASEAEVGGLRDRADSSRSRRCPLLLVGFAMGHSGSRYESPTPRSGPSGDGFLRNFHLVWMPCEVPSERLSCAALSVTSTIAWPSR